MLDELLYKTISFSNQTLPLSENPVRLLSWGGHILPNNFRQTSQPSPNFPCTCRFSFLQRSNNWDTFYRNHIASNPPQGSPLNFGKPCDLVFWNDVIPWNDVTRTFGYKKQWNMSWILSLLDLKNQLRLAQPSLVRSLLLVLSYILKSSQLESWELFPLHSYMVSAQAIVYCEFN